MKYVRTDEDEIVAIGDTSNDVSFNDSYLF